MVIVVPCGIAPNRKVGIIKPVIGVSIVPIKPERADILGHSVLMLNIDTVFPGGLVTYR